MIKNFSAAITAAAALALFAGVASAQTPTPSPTPVAGTQRDVPTWQMGDHWDFTRTLTVTADITDILQDAIGTSIILDYAELTFDFVDKHRLTVTAIGNQPTSEGAAVSPQMTYVRTRSNTSLAGSGGIDGSAAAIGTGRAAKAVVNPPYVNEGEMWTRVSDLADVHERFRLKGIITLTEFLFTPANNDLGALEIEVNLDHNPPNEFADFPYDQIGEQWITYPTRRLFGYLSVDFPTIGSTAPGTLVLGGIITTAAPDDIIFPFDVQQLSPFLMTYAGDEVRQGYASYHGTDGVSNGYGTDYFYSPVAKDYVDRRLPPVVIKDSGGTVTLATLRDINTTVDAASAVVAADPNIGNLQWTPARPAPGAAVTLTGVTAAGVNVTATILETGVTASATSGSGGAFTINLTAPPSDDRSPASADGGSFGVRVVAAGVGAKVLTLQLQGNGIAPAAGWRNYE